MGISAAELKHHRNSNGYKNVNHLVVQYFLFQLQTIYIFVFLLAVYEEFLSRHKGHWLLTSQSFKGSGPVGSRFCRYFISVFQHIDAIIYCECRNILRMLLRSCADQGKVNLIISPVVKPASGN